MRRANVQKGNHLTASNAQTFINRNAAQTLRARHQFQAVDLISDFLSGGTPLIQNATRRWIRKCWGTRWFQNCNRKFAIVFQLVLLGHCIFGAVEFDSDHSAFGYTAPYFEASTHKEWEEVHGIVFQIMNIFCLEAVIAYCASRVMVVKLHSMLVPTTPISATTKLSSALTHLIG